MSANSSKTNPSALVERAYNLKSSNDAKALYRDWAPSYDDAMVAGLGYATPARCAALLASCFSGVDCPVLDVGCGTGLAGAALRQHGFQTIDGIDFSKEMLVQARARGFYRQLMMADLLAPLDIADDTYAAAVCTGTFTHAHVGARCLDEIFRTLKPGGLFSFTVHLDVWGPLGFESTLGDMDAGGAIKTVKRYQGSYYDHSHEHEGWYCLYRKAV